jgi:hypothetical protein
MKRVALFAVPVGLFVAPAFASSSHTASVRTTDGSLSPTLPPGSEAHADFQIDSDESGKFAGDETAWMQFAIRSPSNVGIGHLVTSYDTSSTNLAAYSDFWSWSGGSWPDVFKLVSEGIYTVGVDTVPNLSGPVDMMAFPPGLTSGSFGNVSTSGDSVWEIKPTQTSSSIYGFLLRDGNGHLRWVITQLGWSQASLQLDDLPHIGGGGGLELACGSSPLWFVRNPSPPATLTSAVAAYDVYDAWAP